MSGGSNQRTLFQTWGASVSQNKTVHAGKNVGKTSGANRSTSSSSSRAQVAAVNPPLPPHQNAPWTEIGRNSTYEAERQAGVEYFISDDDEDDDLMVVAVYEAEKSLQLENANSFHNNHATGQNLAPLSTQSCGRIHPDFPGFDSSSAEVWIYPTNYPIRDYQLKISEASLFQNTLVCLPTGLGKTFIASVVMYNFYRWYPAGKIVFMAPTKPLVAQQIEACYKVMGIPQEHMAELTGSTAAKQRQEVWRSKRVFFLTPQVMVNDLSRDTCPAKQIKCVVIDEAHKALGNHAYCQVIKQLSSQTLHFRILALSATPGGDAKSVQSVISNLLISHIELRSEESPDIQAHSHQRSVEKVVVPLGDKLSAYQGRYLQVLEKFTSRLVQNRVMAHKDLRLLSKYQLILARDQFRKNPAPHIKGSHQGILEGDFALCISLYHGYELLMQMGLRSLFFYIQGIMDGSREMSRARNELQRTPTFMDLYHEMETMFLKPPGPDEPFIYSHPKLEKLEEVVVQHFNVWAESSADTNDGVSTRVMIFSSFRESVQEIATMLNQHAPLIKVMTFMGQASSGKGVKGFTQKEQLEVVHRFRQGGFNTLVSTCVGEEGLDIGEVDLIVCFDAQKNPIRLVQRMGRTGRKRRGRIVVILTEGREERTYNQSQSNKRSVYKSITSNKNGFRMYPNSPRMLPEGVNPKLHKMHITCGQFDHREGSRRSIRGRRSHSEGRASLIHPHNLIQQISPKSDGFLSGTEYSLWASTMKLTEDEPHPTLKPSHFMSIPSDSTPQEDNSRDKPPSRELSLWEWRHWQHRPLPFHAVDHSLRCHHFIKVMELIDGMRDEKEGECRYEQQLSSYLHGDTDTSKKKPKAAKIGTKNNKNKVKPCHSSRSELEYIDEEAEMDTATVARFSSTSIPEKRRLPDDGSTDGPPEEDLGAAPSHSFNNDSDMATITEAEQSFRDPAETDDVIVLNARNDEDDDLEEMFYLPKNCSVSRPHSDKPRRDESLKAILSNEAELLSRSPPSLESILEAGEAWKCHPPSPQMPLQPFPVSFSLEVDDDEDDDSCDDVSAPDQNFDEPVTVEGGGEDGEPDSPTWDEVFEDEEVVDENSRDDEKETDSKKGDDVTRLEDAAGVEDEDFSSNLQMDESMDLFEDDEAFMQMTIPDIPTPEDSFPARETNASLAEDCIEKMAEGEHDEALGVKLTIQSSHNMSDRQAEFHKPADHSQNAASCFQSSTVRENPELLDTSHDLFSVNFDLGYSLDDSEDETEMEAAPASPSSKKTADSAAPLPSTSTSSTHRNIFAGRLRESKLSSSQTKVSCWKSKAEELPSPVPSLGIRRTLLSGFTKPGSSSPKWSRAEGGVAAMSTNSSSWQEPVHVRESSPNPARYSDSEEEVVQHKRRQHKVNPLSSPDVSKVLSDVDSPVVVKKKRASVLNVTDETQAEAFSDDDFQDDSMLTRRKTPPGAERELVQRPQKKNTMGPKARQFLDEEAELSEDEEGADVSSDEEDGAELNRSLEGFVVDNTHLSQGLDDSEMQGVYLKSVRSPAVRGKFKMSYKKHHNMDIFSQVPEMDETYAEDSFVVGSDEEELVCNEEEPEDIELLPEVSYMDGRRQYATRRRVFLHKARAKAGAENRTESAAEQRTKTKRSRVICLDDSSEEETGDECKNRGSSTAGSAVPLQANRPHSEPSGQKFTSSASVTIATKVSSLSKGQRSSLSEEQQNERCRRTLENQHLLSDELDFAAPKPTINAGLPTTKAPQSSTAQGPSMNGPPSPFGSVSILVDSRCISSGVELMTSLRQRHGANVHVCSLDSSYFIVSNRMAVERLSQSDLAAMQNRKRLVERLSSLQGMFERVCVIVEKDRSKQGEVSRPFQRTRYYDSTIAALVRAGIRLLWSDGAEESASLLADLAKLEHRKGQGIAVPLEVKGQRRQQTLQLYQSLPSVSHVHALNLLHNFSTIAQLINSSVEAIQKGGCMSRSRAEEIYRCLRYSCDSSFLLNTSKAGKNS
ncbi:Fanconi anemia group M protein [Cyprinodon tularosa]|uniref:Fanconi anemia group M protein n=1 Tax=Cyprinodon tularosa TaxID=77115 RepID=UPI0018E25867|nr:Fanconi anemia group M protein [Cyprinodon tularosa]